MDSQPVNDTIKASDLHPDVMELCQKITDKVHELVLQVESLDANKWLGLADEIDALNSQLQEMLVEKPAHAKSKSSAS